MSPLLRRTLLVLTLLLLAIAVGLVAEVLLTASPDRPFGHTQPGHALGWVGLALILLVFPYSYYKRHGPKPGWPRGWFRLHMAAGIVGPLVIVIHSGAHFHALVPVLAITAMGVVVLSGLIGQAVHYLALRTLQEERRRLMDEGLEQDAIEERLHAMVVQEEAFRLWQMIHAPLTLTFLALVVLHVIGAVYFGGF